jgi:NodT family efflux transporter outer membrane factor (OMF) lipoprotein
MYRLKLNSLILLSCLALTACAVGPDFHAPAAPKTQRYTDKILPRQTVSAPVPGGVSQHFEPGQDIPAQWWLLFHSPIINDLVCKGIANSPNLTAAKAALTEAQENLNAQYESLFFPEVTGMFSGERQRFSASSFGESQVPPSIFNLYNTGVNVSYAFDVFGGERRQVEALQAQVDNQQFQLQAAYLTLTANIVTSAITDASLCAQIQATHELINLQQQQLQIVQKQFQLGGAALTDVMTQETQLAQTRATLPPLEKSLAQTRDALATLVGTIPSETNIPDLDLDSLQLPNQLPVSLPSSLVRQRPDIRASEALLHAASAQIGVATANLLPQFSMTASYGAEADNVAALFTHNANVWTFAGNMLVPIFNGGSLFSKRRASIAAYQQAAAQYRQVVLQAFQNVADSLHALEIDALELQAQSLAETSAQTTLTLTAKQYKLGGVSYLVLLNAQHQYQLAHINRIQAQANRFSDTAALFQALGGGWWNQQPKSEQ